jgi:hypothetical protein
MTLRNERKLIGLQHNHLSENFIDRTENIRWTDHLPRSKYHNVRARSIERFDNLGAAR